MSVVGSYPDEVTILFALLKQWRCLSNVWVDPYTDPEIALLESLEVASGIREHIGVELKIAPLIGLHPETIEVENAQWDIPVPEAIEKAGDGLLVVVCGEAC